MAWSIWKTLYRSLTDKKSRRENPYRGTRCLTPEIQAHRNDPNYRFGMAYHQSDGTTLIEYIYPYDGRREFHVVRTDDFVRQ
jgi:hypothetical protein